MQFDDLNLSSGTSLQLQLINSEGQSERLSARFWGGVPGRKLFLSVPRSGGKIMRFRPGQKLAVRLMVANGIGIFACVVEAQINEPFPLLFVSYPDEVKFKGIRGATRVVVNLPANVNNADALNPLSADGRVADISISGARLELREAIADIGDTLEIEMRVRVDSLERIISLKAIIRSRVERSTQEEKLEYPAVYGVEFTEQNEDELLILYAYVYSQIVAEQTPDPTT